MWVDLNRKSKVAVSDKLQKQAILFYSHPSHTLSNVLWNQFFKYKTFWKNSIQNWLLALFYLLYFLLLLQKKCVFLLNTRTAENKFSWQFNGEKTYLDCVVHVFDKKKTIFSHFYFVKNVFKTSLDVNDKTLLTKGNRYLEQFCFF